VSQRLAWCQLTDDQLLAQCDIDTYRASGPGGQKRNKTSSAVRLRHRPSGLIVIAEESRSQHENKAKALRRLRWAFALKVREPLVEGQAAACKEIDAVRGPDGKLHLVSAKDPRYWPAVAIALDVLHSRSAQVRDAAACLNTTTGNFLSLLELDPRVWEQANVLRQQFGHTPLRSDG